MKKIFTLENTKLAAYPRLLPLFEKLLYVSYTNKILNKLPETQDAAQLIGNFLQQLDIKLNFNREDLARVPKEGPTIIVANHPFGVAEGVALVNLLVQIRPDVKVLANFLLKNTAGLAQFVIAVDPFEDGNKKVETIKSLQEAQRWLENQGVLIIFPAGTVSHWHWKSFSVTDPEWQKSCAQLATRYNATVVPFYFHGRNSWYFQMAGMISPYLRTILLPQQFYAKQHQAIDISIGKPISPAILSKQGNPKQQTAYLREQTYQLAHHSIGLKAEKAIKKLPPLPVATAHPSDLLEKEIQLLPASACLVQQNEFAVYLAGSQEIPMVLKEIGRLRELTFREAGEGTGKEYDLDRYDEYYSHLFIWHKNTKKIIGGYRLGLSDQILPKYGEEGFYISSLYNVKSDFFSRILPAIELGRSFVIPEYQRNPHSLLLLWRAIGQFLVNNPHYVNLYGVVSVSYLFQKLSRDLIVYFLHYHYIDQHLKKLVHAKSRYPIPRHLPRHMLAEMNKSQNIHYLDNLISEIEYDHKGLPILIKQYLSINAKFLNFNLDKEFNDCLDCLCLVSVRDIPMHKAIRYLGKEGAESYFKFHHQQQQIILE